MPKSCEHFHLKLDNNVEQWASINNAKCAKLLVEKTCLIYFYNQQKNLFFENFLNRNQIAFTRKRIDESTYVFCNSNNSDALKALKALPEYTKRTHIKPLLECLLMCGRVTATSIEKADAIRSMFYKHHHIVNSVRRDVQIVETPTGYVVEIVDIKNKGLK